MRKTFCFFLCSLLLFSCTKEEFTPLKRGYYRVSLPERSYRSFQENGCPYRFEYPVYGNIEKKERFFNESVADLCWLNIRFVGLGAKLHLSYKEISASSPLFKLMEDAHKLTFKHTLKAESIDESLIRARDPKTRGILYEIGGDAASSVQFYLTDSTTHFLRGSLYFNVVPNADSLAPVIDFVKTDMLHIISTFEWDNERGKTTP